MGVIERLEHTVQDGENLGWRHGALVHPVPQRTPAHELEDEVVDVPHELHVVDLDQVWMARPRHDLRLLEEALQRDRVRRPDELFDRNLAAETWLLGQVDRTHASPAEL